MLPASLLHHTRFLFALVVGLPAATAAEPTPPTPPVSAPASPAGTTPLPGETVFLDELRGVITVPDVAALSEPVPAGFAGVDTSRTPLLADPAAAELIRKFVGSPMSFGSLDRLCIGLRFWLRLSGEPFVTVHAPPQEVTEGVVRLVVRRATLDGEVRIDGAKWFSEASYRAALPLASGAEIDAAAIQAGVERLNRSAHRRVVLAAEPGEQPGTTRLTLRTQEEKPWLVTAGYNNHGSAVTDENRVSLGASWGDAFGRGDTLGYSFSADPRLEHSRSHSVNYETVFHSGHSVSAFGAYSELESALPAPLTQEGTSWQLGTRYRVPLGKTASGWEHSVSAGADFKYSDNTLEFATIPITDNVTHIVQFGAAYSLSRQGATHGFALTLSLYASPGELTGRNDDEAFDVTRAGAEATYVYGRLDGQYSVRLPKGFGLSIAASLQSASGPLLGSEQLNGAGSAAVRGYAENSAFGDEGVLVNTELHLPAFSVWKRHDQADVFVFFDAATLRDRGPGSGTTGLVSAGVGLNYQWRRYLSLRAAYGWQLKEPEVADHRDSRGHVSATVSF